jgi:hypothetical protein
MMGFSSSGMRTPIPEHLSFGQKLGKLVGGVNVPRPMGNTTPAAADLSFESIRIFCGDGLSLGAWYCVR